jgi:hypothetical protein
MKKQTDRASNITMTVTPAQKKIFKMMAQAQGETVSKMIIKKFFSNG